MKHLQLTTNNYHYGSYYLKDFKGHILFRYYNFKGIHFDATNPSYTFFKDEACEDERYKQQAIQYLTHECSEDYSLEEIYDTVSKLRPYTTKKEPLIITKIGINQIRYLEEVLETKRAILLYCEQEEEFIYYKELFSTKVEMIYNLKDYLTSTILDYSKVLYDETLQGLISSDEVLHIYVGENGLLSCKDIRIDSFIFTTTSTFYNQVLCATFEPLVMNLYCKAGSNMMNYNPFISQGTLSYAHLHLLYKKYGSTIFQEDYETLYLKYPTYFTNYYGLKEYDTNHKNITTLDELLKEKRRNIQDSCKDAITIRSLYVNENYNEVLLDLNPLEYKNNILVDIFALEHCSSATVHFKEVNEKVRDVAIKNQNLVTNFLFYASKKVVHWYNEYREEREQEQIPCKSEHIDYMYCRDQYEDFPLFHKSAIAKKSNGTLDLVQPILKGGSIQLLGKSIGWKREQVNSDVEQDIVVYTPMYLKEENEDYFSVKKEVGNHRINIVIIKDQIICIRKGNVLLPSLGVVVSVKEEVFTALYPNLSFDGEGYNKEVTKIKITLENPTSYSEEEFRQVDWIYGGAMKIYDKDEKNYLKNLENEGWMNPLSCQTQETQIHLLSRHPRTVMFKCKGILHIAIFSGRSKVSIGANYEDIIQILNKYYDGVEEIINMDGGASSVAACYVQDQLVEYSMPCSSLETPAGKIREINAMLCIEW